MKCTEIRAAMLVIFAVLMSFAAGVTDPVSAQTPLESMIVIINARVIDGTGAPARADQNCDPGKAHQLNHPGRRRPGRCASF